MAGWKSSWNSLAMRLMVSFTAFVLAMSVILTILPYLITRHAMEESVEARGKIFFGKMKTDALSYHAMDNFGALRHFLSEIPAVEPEASFGALLDENGVIIAHTDQSLEGKKYEAEGLRSSGDPAEVSKRQTTYGGSRLMELASPVAIGDRKRGTILLGVNYKLVDPVLRKLLIRMGLVGLAMFSVAIFSARPFTLRIIAGLTHLKEITREISGGELRVKVPEEGYDEIRALARDFNAMAKNLRMVLAQIQETGASMGSFSSDFMTVIQDQAASASQQATSVAEVTATMEELSRTSRQIAQNAESVKEAASKSVEVAQAGTTLGREGVEAMTQIKERVGDIARKTLFLGEKSHEIGKVMEIIKEIASESHLLALTAAIESAAAGEHGRRFAVVASEVRRLAEKTRESTETIRGIITEIQSATNSSVEATEQGTREVERWKETIRLSSEAFSEIIATIERTSEASTQISLATHQQTSANEQVVQAMRQIEEMVRVTASKMKESSASASRLREMAGTLQEKTAVFRV